jgi:thioredoxin:protein disulfide reductase
MKKIVLIAALAGSFYYTLQGTTKLSTKAINPETTKSATIDGDTKTPTSTHNSDSPQSSTFDAKNLIKSIQNYLTTTHSITLRIMFALILGILLSLTPCIYPMIPITVGVLQSQGSKSLLTNFLLSSAYTLGISTTFSVFGLLAATSGQAFGYMLANPLFIIFIVALLLYFALSLFGLYNLYIPRFLQKKHSIQGGGSFGSIFLFGLISGSVASPCLSPGLALILAMVATMANKFVGFLLLFSFGIGISTPLLIIGTFSGSINLLPRAGGWMLEIQKIFGFMLIGMCFYYISNIAPWWSVLIMMTIFSLCAGLYYLRSASTERSAAWRNLKNVLGITGVALSVFLTVESFQELYYPHLDDDIQTTWYTDYEKAVSDAQAENKKLFLDFWAPYCSLCKLIASTTLKEPAIAKVLAENYIVVSINGNDAQLEPFKTLKERYAIQGFPNLLIVDPTNGKELYRWRGEIEDEATADVVAIFEQYAQV